MVKIANFAIAVLLSCSLVGCGFSLRQPYQLPKNLAGLEVLSANALSPMSIELHRALGQNSLKPTSAANVGKIEIVSEALNREVLSVNDRARVSEFVLIASVTVRLLEEDQELIAPFALTVRREYSFDERQALGAAQEEDIIGKELRQELAQGVLNRISATFAK